jgi:hypothetical protein
MSKLTPNKDDSKPKGNGQIVDEIVASLDGVSRRNAAVILNMTIVSLGLSGSVSQLPPSVTGQTPTGYSQPSQPPIFRDYQKPRSSSFPQRNERHNRPSPTKGGQEKKKNINSSQKASKLAGRPYGLNPKGWRNDARLVRPTRELDEIAQRVSEARKSLNLKRGEKLPSDHDLAKVASEIEGRRTTIKTIRNNLRIEYGDTQGLEQSTASQRSHKGNSGSDIVMSEQGPKTTSSDQPGCSSTIAADITTSVQTSSTSVLPESSGAVWNGGAWKRTMSVGSSPGIQRKKPSKIGPAKSIKKSSK